ncbi:hypothetical protein, partial [Nocardioides sp.]|uniref:hypothetical protein n=1 Tax=Nocardioides sp. TaxID=35761 RepID=UPI0027376308
NTITSKQLKNNSVKSKHVKNGTLRAVDLQPGLLGAKSLPRKRVIATPGASVAAARAAAPQIVLYKQGALTIYGKCFTNTAGPTTYYETYIKTSQNGTIFDSRNDSLDGGPAATDFLNTNTPETDAQLEEDSVGANSAAMDSEDDSDFAAFAPDGTTLRGFTAGAVKNGTLAGGNGVYGAGNVCLFSGGVFGN